MSRPRTKSCHRCGNDQDELRWTPTPAGRQLFCASCRQLRLAFKPSPCQLRVMEAIERDLKSGRSTTFVIWKGRGFSREKTY